MGDVLIEIVQKLRDAEVASATGPSVVVPIPYLFAIANSLEKSTITPEVFKEFVGEIHNSLIRLDSARRSALFRVIRFCLQGSLHVKLFIQEELHWIVIATLEKDPSVEFNVERIQALKIIDRVRKVAADVFPVGFARSLVAIANCKEDNFRRLCLDSLRELALVNPSIVGTVGGFTTLLDAVLDPISPDSAEKILHSILFLLNDPITRKILTPCVDLKILLSPFSDLDTDEKDIQPRWTAAKNAFATVMKTWVGVVMLTADELALPFLMRMLRDPKLPTETHAIILDCIQDVLTPIYCVKRKVNLPSRNLDSDVRINAKSKEPSIPDLAEKNRDKRANSDSDTQGSGRNKSILAKDKLLTNSGSSNSLTNLVKEPSTTTNRDRGSNSHRSSFSFADPFFSTVKQSSSTSNISQSGELATSNNMNGNGTGNGATGSSGNLAGQNSNNGSKHFSISSLFTRHNHNNMNHTSPGMPFRRASATAVSSKSSMPGNYPTTRPESAKLEKKGGGADGIIFAQKPVTPIHINTSSTVSDKPSTPVLDHVGEFESEFDIIYNLMDNYAALLCSSFMHVDLIQSLITLGTEGERAIAERSRKLLVTFFTVLSNLLPESVCAELLISPSLLELAASLGPRKSPNKSYKASLILLDIANTFTIMPLPSTQATTLTDANSGALISAQSQSARPRTGSNVRGSLYVTPTSPLKSNLPSLNIQNLYLLMEEVKVCTLTSHRHFYEQSSSQISESNRSQVENRWRNGGLSGGKGSSGGNGGEAVYSQPSDLLSTIAAAVTPVIDKNEFNRQMDVTKVKEGKEPFKWDWITISQLLEHSFTQPDRLSEALKSKWLRRISGFFRCSPDEKGYFANMDWEPNNLQYLEIACNLYSVLMKEDVGFQFLTQDRRGMIFNEIAYELELLTNYASNRNSQLFNLNPFSGSNGASGNGGNSSTGVSNSKMVFRMHSCSYSMAREFFSLLGRILRNNKSRRLLDHTNVFQHLTVLGQYHSLDYVSRLVITSLSFTDGGIISRHLYQFWTADEINGSCSKLLREYLFHLLRVLIRCQHHHKHFQDQELYMWCVETILSQLAIDDDTSHNINVNESLSILYKGMMECLHSRTCAQLVISKRPRFILNHYQQLLTRQTGNVGTVVLNTSPVTTSSDEASTVHNKEMLLNGILIRLLGFSEGIQFLSEKSYVETIIQSWCQQRNKDYATLVEERMNNAMLQAHHLKAQHAPPGSTSVDMLSLIQPIPIKIPDVAFTYNAPSPPAFTASSDFDVNGFDPYQQLDFDFHGLFRVPWNIEAKIVNHGLMTSDIVSNSGEYIRIDAFLDISEVHSPLAYEVTYDKNRYLKVRGIVLDNKGFPSGKAVNPNASVFSTLLAGISPIFKNGTIQPLSESGSLRKRTSTNARETSNSVTTSSRSSFVGSSTPGANNEVFQDNDLPVTLGQEQSYEWTTCRAGHRQGSNLYELEDGRFAVAIPNEPVVFIFSRKAPLTSTSSVGQRNKSASNAGSRSNSISDPWFDANRTNRMDSSRSGGMLYLVEIHYFICIETGQAMFVPMPRHLFGELGRTVDGCAELTKRNLIFEMVGKAHNLFDQLQKPSSTSSSSITGVQVSTPLSLSATSPHANATSMQSILIQHANNTLELRSILWSLGHLAANDLGLGLVLGVDPYFIDWCVECVANCNYFSLRGTFFHILGLISRSLAGGKKLSRLGWHSVDFGNPSAVTIPRSTSAMFGRSGSTSSDNSASSSGVGMKKAALALSRLNVPHAPVMPFMNNLTIPQAVKNLVPFPQTGTLTPEQEVLNIIVKMPGVILYRECKSKLDHIRRENSDIFSKRSLFVDVMRILEVYNFKLSARRDILALFSETAKQRPVTQVSSTTYGESFSERQ